MKSPGFNCDNCMKLGSGQELRKWWIVSQNTENGISRMGASPFVSEYAGTKDCKHACSRRCADKLFHEWLRSAKNDEKEFAKYLAGNRYGFSALFSFGEDND